MASTVFAKALPIEAMELYWRLAALERRVNKLEAGMQELDQVVDPQGWIGEAFHVMEVHMNRTFQQVDQKFQKIDTELCKVPLRCTC